ncbi:hypothetical protein R3P38DRAFT_2827597, partial [Favolaschia claudopus]
ISNCVYPVSRTNAIRMAGAWEGQLVYDLIIFGLTVFRFHKQSVKIPGSIISHMARDGTFYFVALAAINLANILMFYLGNAWLASSLSWFTSSVSVTLVCRLVLHLHQVTELDTLTDPIRPNASSIIFASQAVDYSDVHLQTASG